MILIGCTVPYSAWRTSEPVLEHLPDNSKVIDYPWSYQCFLLLVSKASRTMATLTSLGWKRNQLWRWTIPCAVYLCVFSSCYPHLYFPPVAAWLDFWDPVQPGWCPPSHGYGMKCCLCRQLWVQFILDEKGFHRVEIMKDWKVGIKVITNCLDINKKFAE